MAQISAAAAEPMKQTPMYQVVFPHRAEAGGLASVTDEDRVRWSSRIMIGRKR